jgi:hypothetical protein
MNLFHSLLQKIGIEKPAAPAPSAADNAKATVDAAMAKAEADAKARVAAQAQAQAAAHQAAVNAAAQAAQAAHAAPVVAPAPVPAAAPAPLKPAAVPLVDVVSKIESLAKAHPGLDWKVSIVDLLKVLDMDSSLENRKELAAELGCPAELMKDSASMNVWLHKTVLQKIAENGGNIPAGLLD